MVWSKSVISKIRKGRPRTGIESKRHKKEKKPTEQNCAQRGYNKFQATVGQDNAREVTVTQQQWGWLCWDSSHFILSIIFQKSTVTNSGCQLRHFVTMEAETISKTVLLLCNCIRHYPRRLYHFSHRRLQVLWNIMKEYLLHKTRNARIN